jgi:hypothetical protein
VADTPALLEGSLGNFYNIDQLGGSRVSDEAYRTSFNVAVAMSAIAAHGCIATWQAGFRADLPKIDVPVMVIQGKTGKRLPGLIADMELVVVEGGPHGIPWTHADQVNAALSASSATRPPEPPVPGAAARSRSGAPAVLTEISAPQPAQRTALITGQCRRREPPVYLG